MSATFPMNTEGVPLANDCDEHPEDCVCDMCTR